MDMLHTGMEGARPKPVAIRVVEAFEEAGAHHHEAALAPAPAPAPAPVIPQSDRGVAVPAGIAAFPNAENLEDWLLRHGQDTSLWGQDTAKEVEDLLREVNNGRCTLVLDNGVVTRRLHATKLRIMRRGSAQYLVETKQLLGDENEIVRNALPNSKMAPAEDPTEAALRGLRKLMAEKETSDAQALGVFHVTDEYHTSPSYPHLRCKYTFYEVGIEVVRALPFRP
jgi:hypothetical protein